MKSNSVELTSTIIATLAFVVSLTATLVSYLHTRQQDVQNLRGELRAILQRLTALGKENVEIYSKFKNEPGSISHISGFINQENLMLAVQAHEILGRLPAAYISSVDYYTVGYALMNSRRFDFASIDLKKSAKVAAGLDDDVGALRGLAKLEMVMGNVGEARQTFQKALDIFGKYPSYDDFTRRTTTIATRLNWADAELGIREFGNAEQHLVQAQDLANGLPPTAGDFWGKQLSAFRQTLNQVRTNPSATPPRPVQALATALTDTAVPSFTR